MAALNLIPNPTVLVVQIGVFLTGFVAIKKLFVEPYMALRDKREALTVGSQDEAQRALAASDSAAGRIESRLSALSHELKAARLAQRDAALAEKDKILAAAQSRAKSAVATVEGLIAADLATERAKVPGIIQALTDEVYALALA